MPSNNTLAVVLVVALLLVIAIIAFVVGWLCKPEAGHGATRFQEKIVRPVKKKLEDRRVKKQYTAVGRADAEIELGIVDEYGEDSLSDGPLPDDRGGFFDDSD